MYNQLIDVDKDGNVFMQDNSIALMPKLWEVYKDKHMGSNMVKWIVAVYDYKSPYRRLPIEERKSRVSYVIFDKNKNTKEDNEKVVEAIDEYIKLQYDPLIDEYNAMCEQSYNMTKVYREMTCTAANLEEMTKLQQEIGKAAKSRDAHKDLIKKDQESDVKIQGTGSGDFSIFEEDERMGK